MTFPSGEWSWQPEAAPATISLVSGLKIGPTALEWPVAWAKEPSPVQVLDGSPRTTRPGVVSIPLTEIPLRTFDVVFPEAVEPLLPNGGQDGQASTRMACPPRNPTPTTGDQRGSTFTHIRPPSDVIKLADRLFYLLQPPLEYLLADEGISFPYRPFSYQLEGVAFLYSRHQAILADEMGLGKTMQAITSIRLLVRQGQLRRVLLVCPKPLVTNWQREFAMWAPELPLTVIEGTPARRQWLWHRRETLVTIANYELVVRDASAYFDSDVHYDLVVLDESQRIKNRASVTNQVICSISRSRSWALTGTPVENGPDDLIGIFEFLAPGYLNREMKPRRLGRAVSDYILRRTKDQVLDELPPKLFRDAHVTLTEQQRESYRLAKDEGVLRLNKMDTKVTIQHVFELILRLKQICNFDPVTGESAKMERLTADLEECAASGRKAVVFSQWVEPLMRLREGLARFRPLEYHGRISSRRREGTIEQFRNDPNCHVLLMSYGAGGVGLNLQFVAYVFLLDRWWNPAVEDQAINRAHRIGVSHPVTVTRFLALDTIEERINQILEEKRKLCATIFSSTQPIRNLGLTQQELFGLFDLVYPGSAIEKAA